MALTSWSDNVPPLSWVKSPPWPLIPLMERIPLVVEFVAMSISPLFHTLMALIVPLPGTFTVPVFPNCPSTTSVPPPSVMLPPAFCQTPRNWTVKVSEPVLIRI